MKVNRTESKEGEIETKSEGTEKRRDKKPNRVKGAMVRRREGERHSPLPFLLGGLNSEVVVHN